METAILSILTAYLGSKLARQMVIVMPEARKPLKIDFGGKLEKPLLKKLQNDPSAVR